MRLFAISFMCVFLTACPEYNLQGDPSLYAEPNPPDLSNEVKEDRIVQVTVPAVDVLWVIDNSCSMGEEQAALSENFPKFVQYFTDGAGLDYHIGVASTDWDNYAGPEHRGKLREHQATGHRWIDDTVSNPVEIFRSMADLGTDGSADEKGRAQTYGVLELLKDTYNSGFYREDAFLAIITISDEDDYSGTNPISKTEFISWLRNLKSSEDMISYSSIVGPYGGCPTAAEPGADYLQVTEAIGGIDWSICDPNWDQVLEELGMQAAGLRREFFLSEVPVLSSIAVRVEENGTSTTFTMDEDYEYSRSRNSIRFFTYVPNPLAEVFITYDVQAGAQIQAEVTEDTDE